MSQITTNNYTEAVLESSSAQSQTTNITKGKIMNNQTTLEAEIVSADTNTTITTGDLEMNTNTINNEAELSEVIPTTVTDNEAIETGTTDSTATNRTKRLVASNIPWLKFMQAPTTSEIEAIKEARRVELINENNNVLPYGVEDIEKCVNLLLDNNQLCSQGITLTLIDGKKFEVEALILKSNSHKVVDMIEPHNGTGTLTHFYYFDATYTTGLRGNETYKVIYTLSSIKTIIKEFRYEGISKNSILKALIEVLTLAKVSTSDIYDIEKRLEVSFVIDKGNTFVADALKAMREAKNVVPVSSETGHERKAFELMKDYAFLNNQGKTQIINTTKLGLVTSSESGLKSLFKNKLIDGVNPVDIWMQSDKRPLFTDIKFDPSYSSNDDKYNLFKGFKYKAKLLVDISLFKDFVKEIICSGDELLSNIVCTFLAQMVQNPGRKMGTALVLLSAKGTGKSSFVHVVGKLMEGYFMQTAESKRLLGEFNNHLASTLLFYANELTFTDNKRVVAKLKNLITETEFTYEIKGGATFTGKNYNRLIIDSNDDLAVVQTADERRFIYPVISEARIGDTEYFNKLYASFEEEGFYESLMYELMNFDYSEWEKYLKTPPKNVASEEQMMASFSSLESFWLNCLEEGRIPYVHYDVTYDGRLNIANESLYQSYAKFTRANGGRVNVDSVSFGRDFKKHILKDLDLSIASKIMLNGVRKNSHIYETRVLSLKHFKSIKRMNNIDYDVITDWEDALI